MNAAGRKEIDRLFAELRDAQEKIENIGAEIRSIAESEQEKFDNLSDGLQQAESGQKLEAMAEALNSLADYCEGGDIEAAIDEVEGQL